MRIKIHVWEAFSTVFRAHRCLINGGSLLLRGYLLRSAHLDYTQTLFAIHFYPSPSFSNSYLSGRGDLGLGK